MKKTITILSFSVIFLLIFSLALVAARPKWKPIEPTCPITQDTDIVFYGENAFSAVGDLSESWITHFLNWWNAQDNDFQYLELSTDDVINCNFDDYPNLKVYIQPGGNAYQQQRYLGSEGKQNLINYINSGKGYVGICAGYYYVAGDYYWEGSYYDHSDLLGIYPTLEGSIQEIADYPDYSMTSLDNGFNAIYYGGPTIGYEQTSINSVLGIIDSSFNYRNLPAVIKNNNMLLTSVHLEAYENDGITGLTTEDRTENYKYLANLINEVSETTFNVPAYGEVEPPIPSDDFFFDGFEEGFDWATYGEGTPWTISTDTAYEGTFSARAKKTGAGDYSYMEKEIPECNATLTFNYKRKLVGLDAADDFAVSYQNGDWIDVEHLGRSTGRDSSFLSKSFVIPNTSTKIRFACEVGAVSEKCYVDNVELVCK